MKPGATHRVAGSGRSTMSGSWWASSSSASAYSPVTVRAKTLDGRRSEPSRADCTSLAAGTTLPRSTPFMSGTRHSTSPMRRSSIQVFRSDMQAFRPCRDGFVISVGSPGLGGGVKQRRASSRASPPRRPASTAQFQPGEIAAIVERKRDAAGPRRRPGRDAEGRDLEPCDEPRRPPAAEAEPVLRASIYEELRRRMITGKITPGVGLSTRGLAHRDGRQPDAGARRAEPAGRRGRRGDPLQAPDRGAGDERRAVQRPAGVPPDAGAARPRSWPCRRSPPPG